MKIEAYINDESHEYLLNLVAQGYYSDAYEFIIKLTDAFHNSLLIISGNIILGK